MKMRLIRCNGSQLTISRRRSGCEVSMIFSNLPEAKSKETAANVKMLDENTSTWKAVS